MPFHLDTSLLKSFIAVAETGSFSQAAEIVGRTQSAVSLQIKKLEEALKCRLFERSNRQAALTEQGEIFLGYARKIVELQWDAYSRLNEPEVKGEIRLGAPEDFATHYLPSILASFSKQHPNVQLAFRCDLTLNLLNGFRKGEYDMILARREQERVKGGTKVRKEPLVWAATDHYQVRWPIPLVLSPQPCIYRARALSALERSRKAWNIIYTSTSLAGTIAAVRAGLGVTVLPKNMMPEGLSAVRGSVRLPPLPDSEIVLMKKERLPAAGKVLAAHIISCLEQSS